MKTLTFSLCLLGMVALGLAVYNLWYILLGGGLILSGVGIHHFKTKSDGGRIS